MIVDLGVVMNHGADMECRGPECRCCRVPTLLQTVQEQCQGCTDRRGQLPAKAAQIV